MGKHISAILLAAGESSRFEGTKQLIALDGVNLVDRALATIRRSKVDDIVVVLGNRAEEVRAKIKGSGFRVAVNKRFREGMSTSLKAGVKALPRDSDAVVVILADQPFVTAGLIDRLIAKYLEQSCRVVTSSSGGLVSPPVLFDRSIFEEIALLKGDTGAKSIVLNHKSAERVEVDPEALLDVDTAEDFEKAKELLSRRPGRGWARARPAGGRAPAHPSSS